MILSCPKNEHNRNLSSMNFFLVKYIYFSAINTETAKILKSYKVMTF